MALTTVCRSRTCRQSTTRTPGHAARTQWITSQFLSKNIAKDDCCQSGRKYSSCHWTTNVCQWIKQNPSASSTKKWCPHPRRNDKNCPRMVWRGTPYTRYGSSIRNHSHNCFKSPNNPRTTAVDTTADGHLESTQPTTHAYSRKFTKTNHLQWTTKEGQCRWIGTTNTEAIPCNNRPPEEQDSKNLWISRPEKW